MQATEALLIAIRAIPPHPALPLKGGRDLLLDVDGQGGLHTFFSIKRMQQPERDKRFRTPGFLPLP
jgi:hypothetical protein